MTILELHWRFQKSTNTHNVFALVFCAQSILYTKFHSKTQNDISLVFCKHDCSLQPEQKQKNTFPLYYGTTFTFIMQFLYTKCSIQKSQSSHLDGFCCKKKSSLSLSCEHIIFYHAVFVNKMSYTKHPQNMVFVAKMHIYLYLYHASTFTFIMLWPQIYFPVTIFSLHATCYLPRPPPVF